MTTHKGKFKCDHCGNNRYFYNDISVRAKKRIDLKNGAKNDKVFDVDIDHEDNFYEDIVYCEKCDEQVDIYKWNNEIESTE